MKIYCLHTFTGVSDYCGFYPAVIVSTKRAIDHYIKITKERILSIVSKKSYFRQYPVYISVRIKEPDSEGVFKIVSSYTVVLKLNSDNSFHYSLNIHDYKRV